MAGEQGPPPPPSPAGLFIWTGRERKHYILSVVVMMLMDCYYYKEKRGDIPCYPNPTALSLAYLAYGTHLPNKSTRGLNRQRLVTTTVMLEL